MFSTAIRHGGPRRGLRPGLGRLGAGAALLLALAGCTTDQAQRGLAGGALGAGLGGATGYASGGDATTGLLLGGGLGALLGAATAYEPYYDDRRGYYGGGYREPYRQGYREPYRQGYRDGYRAGHPHRRPPGWRGDRPGKGHNGHDKDWREARGDRGNGWQGDGRPGDGRGDRRRPNVQGAGKGDGAGLGGGRQGGRGPAAQRGGGGQPVYRGPLSDLTGSPRDR